MHLRRHRYEKDWEGREGCWWNWQAERAVTETGERMKGQCLSGLHLAGRILFYRKKTGYEIRGLSRPGVRQVWTATAASHLHPRYKHMQDKRPFEEIITEQVCDGVSDQTRLSILSQTAGLKRGKVTDSAVGSKHVVLLQKKQSTLP